MRITKPLKRATFEYDEEIKQFFIKAEDGIDPTTERPFQTIRLNKVYAFAFMRFVIRMAQRNWLKKASSLNKSEEILDSIELEEDDEPNQMELF